MHAVVSTLLEKGKVNGFDSLLFGVLNKSLQIKNIYSLKYCCYFFWGIILI